MQTSVIHSLHLSTRSLEERVLSPQGIRRAFRDLRGCPGEPGGLSRNWVQSSLVVCWPSEVPQKRYKRSGETVAPTFFTTTPSFRWWTLVVTCFFWVLFCFALFSFVLSIQPSLWVGGKEVISSYVWSWWNSLPYFPLPKPTLGLTPSPSLRGQGQGA